MELKFGPRRGEYIDIAEELRRGAAALNSEDVQRYENLDLMYRTLCACLYNYAPMSGHPGGSISSGRFLAALLFETMEYDFSDPDRQNADIISFGAGHKVLGLYAMWALRNELVRIGKPGFLPGDVRMQLRLEDLLGFRRNRLTQTPLFQKFNAKALDGHPTPMTPFVRLCTGASGVGVAASFGLAFAAADYYGSNAPRVHVIEGEGGITPGRVYEAFAAAGTAALKNAVIHIDWNQASIDSNSVCRDANRPGDYVQWDPLEFAYLHDWNVILVSDGRDFQQIVAAQRRALAIDNAQPVAIVYRTTKGWQYGIEGNKSHGAGHALCSAGFYESVKKLCEETEATFPTCQDKGQRCKGGNDADVLEQCYWNALLVVRQALEAKPELVTALTQKLARSKQRLDGRKRKPRADGPEIEAVYEIAKTAAAKIPLELVLTPGQSATLRGELGRTLNYYNKASRGAIFSSSADLLGSTSINLVGKGFAEGYWNTTSNLQSRTLSIGGICEDAQSGVMAGVSTFGQHIGVCSSYGAFMAALGHIASRLHAIGCEAKKGITGESFRPYFLVCAHAGVKTGEDGPTHADPQSLQLIQGNFPKGTVISLTPWDPQELWVLVSAALYSRPAVICPYVTRPSETVIDRKALSLAPAEDARQGVYALYRSTGKSQACVVLQGSEVAYEYVSTTLPLLKKNGIDIDAYYVASAELFDLLPKEEQQRIFPQELASVAMGITGFTLPTMFRWVTSDRGRESTLHPFRNGHFLGSGRGEIVVKEAGLDGDSQYEAIKSYLKS